MRQYVLKPGDRVLRRFFLNEDHLSCIMGPVGGGKTLACLQRFARFAIRQAPHPDDGVRRTRWVSIRDTYRNLERTTLRSWHAWWPKTKDNWRGGANGEPGVGTYRWGLPDGTRVEMEVIFAAVGEQDIEEFAGGFEVTGFHIGEASTLPEEIYFKMLERVGRFPRVDSAAGFLGATYSAGWLDCNAPNYGNHIERNFVTDKRAGFEFYRQPGGLDADAENLDNLSGGRRYYERIAASNPDHYVRRMVHNMFGFDRSGKPVYPQYNPFKHLAKIPLKPLRGRKLFCGMDQGRQPAAVFAQTTIDGQLRLLRELVMVNTGPAEFARALRQMIEDDFPDFDVVLVADPAAFNPGDNSETADDVWAMTVENVLDMGPLIEAPSNRRDAREAPLRNHMLRALSAEQEAFVVDPRCRMVAEGLNQMFRFRKVSASGQPDRYANEVEKNDWSHPCEAAEYAALAAVGLGEAIHARRRAEVDAQRGREQIEEWRPHGF